MKNIIGIAHTAYILVGFFSYEFVIERGGGGGGGRGTGRRE